jgi:hypothetical protein
MVVKIAYFERMVAQQQAQEPPSALVTALELLNRLLSHTPRPSIAHICHQLHALLEHCFNSRCAAPRPGHAGRANLLRMKVPTQILKLITLHQPLRRRTPAVVELLCGVLRKLYSAFPLADANRPQEAQKMQAVSLPAFDACLWHTHAYHRALPCIIRPAHPH